METSANQPESDDESFGSRVRSAVIWRSGSQIVAQLVMWTSTFLVIRILAPADYGLFAMTQVVLVLLNLLNGYGFASAIIQRETLEPIHVRQLFGMLLLLNLGLGAAQFLAAPLAAAYFRQPEVTHLLRVQSLLYVTTPFIALPYALLSREMDYRGQARINLASAVIGALTALGCALSGLGVWTLVAAPMALFWSRAIGMTLAARSLVWPSFDFRGTASVFGFGGAMMLTQVFWFFQSQADIFIAGRSFSPHELGIYTTALLLTQILVGKFVPPLNEVAFSAYARIQSDRAAVAGAFVNAVRLILLIALPFYAGLWAVAGPLVLTVIGPKWAETVPVVHILALAMPLMTMQILFAPATNALGLPRIAVRNAAMGAVLMPIAFFVGVRFGLMGLAWAWLVAMTALLVATAANSLPVIGVRVEQLARAILPALLASAAMALLVTLVEAQLPPMAPPIKLTILATVGAATYGALLWLFARAMLLDAIRIARGKPPVAATPAL